MSNSRLTLRRIAYPVRALGPGQRLALWVAGCPLRCPGCVSPELQPFDAGKPIGIERLADHILGLTTPLDGLTLTGGEPFAQPAALAALWELLSPERPRWNLLAFSGYTLPRLRRHAETRRLLAWTDLLIAGPYRAARPSGQPLLASANQRMHPLTPRGAAMRREIIQTPASRAELGILPDRRGWLIGILAPEQRQRLHDELHPAP